jgi:Na+-driven multidrug efflux pump
MRHIQVTSALQVVVYVSRNLCYMRLQLAAAVLVPTQLAAHQAVWCLYTIASFATTTLEQAGIAFLPQSKTTRERRMTAGIIRTLGVIIGGLLGAICFALSSFGVHLFSADVLVHGPMKQIAPWCGCVMLLVGIDVSAQALIIASGNSSFLARSFVLTLVALVTFMSYASRWNLIGVWAGLVFFFGVRCLQSSIGALRLGNTSA